MCDNVPNVLECFRCLRRFREIENENQCHPYITRAMKTLQASTTLIYAPHKNHLALRSVFFYLFLKRSSLEKEFRNEEVVGQNSLPWSLQNTAEPPFFHVLHRPIICSLKPVTCYALKWVCFRPSDNTLPKDVVENILIESWHDVADGAWLTWLTWGCFFFPTNENNLVDFLAWIQIT